MPQLNGIDALKIINQLYPYCLIIIMTAYSHYAIDAINLEVFRYMLKEDCSNLFNLTLQAALNRLSHNYKHHYLIVSSRKHLKIHCQNILYCYKSSKMSIIVTTNESYRERKSLQKLLYDLNATYHSFIMIERSYIVNIQYVKGVDKNEIILNNNERLPIGNTYLNYVKQTVDNYWRGIL